MNKETTVYGFYYGFTKPVNKHRVGKDPIILFKNLKRYKYPLYVYDQYGWVDNCRKRNGRKIYPPYKIKFADKGDEYYIGKYVIECSKIEYIGEEEE